MITLFSKGQTNGKNGGHFIIGYSLTHTNLWSFSTTNVSILYVRIFSYSGSNLRNIFTGFTVGLSDQKLNSKNARNFFIIVFDYYRLSWEKKRRKWVFHKHNCTRRHYLRTGLLSKVAENLALLQYTFLFPKRNALLNINEWWHGMPLNRDPKPIGYRSSF